MSDFKELIPEFYDSNGEFLQNVCGINFGTRQGGLPVTDVELPPWAKTPKDFVAKLREALESEYVSEHLHEWIDLVFGQKQRGKEAELADNVFVHITYEGTIDLESVKDANERAALETQIMEFGQTPRQLFDCPHPPRSPFSPSVVPPSDQVSSDVEVVDGTCNVHSGLDSATVSTSKNVTFSHVHSHRLHRQTILDVRWSPYDQRVLSSSQDGTLKLYSMSSNKQLHSCSPSSMPISSIVLIPGTETVIAGSWDNNIYVYSLEYGRTVNTSLAHDDAISQLSMHGNLLVSSSWDSTVKLWTYGVNVRDVILLDIQAELEHDAGVNCVCQNNDNSRVVSGTHDGHIYMWDPESFHVISRRHAHLQSVSAVCFSPDGHQLASCGTDGFLKIFDVNTGSDVFAKNSCNQLKCVIWRDKYIITGCDDGHMLVWDFKLGEVVHKFKAHEGAVTCIDTEDSKGLCSGGADQTVHVWNWMF